MENNVVTCKKGWERIYQPIIDTIIAYDIGVKKNEDKIGIQEIREENGIMQFDLIHKDNLSPRILRMVHDGIKASYDTCEFCGTTDRVGATMNFGIHTCCYDCWKKEISPRFPNSLWKEHYKNR